MHRDGSTPDEVRARLSRQMPVEEKRRYADYIIDTSGTKEAPWSRPRRYTSHFGVWRDENASSAISHLLDRRVCLHYKPWKSGGRPAAGADSRPRGRLERTGQRAHGRSEFGRD